MKSPKLLKLLCLIVLLVACAPVEPVAPTETPSPSPTAVPTITYTIAPTITPSPSPTAAPVTIYNEAPMLQEKVTAGELPLVDERLPEELQVIEVVENIGQYGGIWHEVTSSSSARDIMLTLYDPPVRWKPDYTGYEPGLLIHMPEWNDDGKTITLTFRQGLRWSDGEPFAADVDLKFWWEDMALNEDYDAVQVPWWARNSDGSPATMEFPDAVTWILKFDSPQYLAPYALSQYWEWANVMKPAHFLKPHHPAYTDGAAYYKLVSYDHWNLTPGYPCLMAWCLKEYQTEKSWLFERNPYYWKVDAAGNQLPYIDAISVTFVGNYGERLQQITQGRYDCTFRGASKPSNRSSLLEQATAGNYRLVPGWMDGAGAWPGWIVNQDYHEAVEYDSATETEQAKAIRALLREQDFRKGLSHALNRQNILETVWDGSGEAKQFTLSPQSPHFAGPEGQEVYQAWAQADVAYDPDQTSALFDTIGFIDQDGDGWRDLPGGQPFELVIDVSGLGDDGTATEIFAQDLEAVGVKTSVYDLIGNSMATTRAYNGLFMLREAHASELDIWAYPDWLFPVRQSSHGFPMQGLWYATDGAEGWEPEANSPAARLQAFFNTGSLEPDFDKRNAIVWDAVRVHIEEGPFIIGATGDQPMSVACKNYFKNVPEYGVLGPWAPSSPGNMHPEQFWMDQ